MLMAAALAFAAKTVAWLLQLRWRNGGIVDAIWAWTLGGIGVLFAALGPAPLPVRLAVAAVAGVWGLRLGTHLWRRNFRAPEDFRYARFRADWGAKADRNMFWFFQFQNLFTLGLAASAYLPACWRGDAPPPAAFVVAGALWLIAVVGEGLADAQMARFRADPANRGQVCRVGLWAWSRHPNYFFECLHWLAYVPLAWGAPWFAGSLLAPLLMAFLLMKFSGVPLLEAEMMRRKPGYADYVRTTSALIPLPPRRG